MYRNLRLHQHQCDRTACTVLLHFTKHESLGIVTTTDNAAFVPYEFMSDSHSEAKPTSFAEKYPALVTGFFFFMWYAFQDLRVTPFMFSFLEVSACPTHLTGTS
jgi:hypothetical protein